MIQTVFNWLRGYPGLENLQLEALGPNPRDAGLFFRGLTLVKRQKDILGGEFLRKRLEFYLERHCAQEPGTLWMEAFSQWAEANAPDLGEGSECACGQGRMVRCDETGLHCCRLTLTFTFDQTFQGGM